MRMTDDAYPESPGDRAKLEDEVRARIQSIPGVPYELREELSKYANSFLEAKAQKAPKDFLYYGGVLGWTNWFIRNDDLDLVALLSPSACGIATYASVPNATPWVLAVTLLMSIAALTKRLRAKSVTLTSEECQVLMALKHSGPTTLAGLLNLLNHVTIVGDGSWSEERLLEILKKLQAVRVRDGSVEAYVAQAADGHWSTNGV